MNACVHTFMSVFMACRRASCNPYSEALNRMRDADRADHHAGGGGGPGSGGGGSGAAGGGSAGAGGCFPVSFTSLYEGIVASMVNSGVMACKCVCVCARARTRVYVCTCVRVCLCTRVLHA